MALASNALTTVASLEAYMRRPIADSDLITVYHDESASATAATVQVTSTTMVLVITGGANAGTSTLTLADSATISALVTAIGVLAKGWVARSISANADPERLIEYAATSAFGSKSEQYLRGIDTYAHEQAINAASDLMERWCGRTFASTAYRQMFNGPGRGKLRVRQFPIVSVARVAIGRAEALKVKNTSTDAKEATVSNDLTNLTLTIVGGANAGSDTIAIGSNTVTQLVAAIIAKGKNWTAETVSTTAGAWPGTELFKHEAFRCLTNYTSLFCPDESETDIRVDYEAGIIRRCFGTEPFYHLHRRRHYPTHVAPLAEIGGDLWPEGQLNIFVSYTAGYATIPDDLARLCDELSATILRAGTHDSSVTTESTQGYSYAHAGNGWMTDGFKDRLNAHRIMPPIPTYEDV
jgi:hypothetical protein